MDAMRDLIKAAWGAGQADGSAGTEAAVGVSGSADFERRVMLAVARAENDRLRRRAHWTALAAAACLVGLLISLPIDALIDSIGNAAKELTTISMHP